MTATIAQALGHDIVERVWPDGSVVTSAMFSHEVRILACAQCGAPLEVSVAGGQVACQYCGANNVVGRRDESADVAAARMAGEDQRSESERMDRLREQSRTIELPSDLAELSFAGAVKPGKVDETKSSWIATRQRIADAGPFSEQERLFLLTLLLVPALDGREARALIERAVEELSDPKHRHVLRCMLAARAALAGDVDAASQWLEPCNPRPFDLVMDSSYRVARATAAAARDSGEAHTEILSLLGYRHDDVPIWEHHEVAVMCLRVHALQASGDPRAATEQLLSFMCEDPRRLYEVKTALRDGAAIGLSGAAGSNAVARFEADVERRLRPHANPGGAITMLVLMLLFGWTARGSDIPDEHQPMMTLLLVLSFVIGVVLLVKYRNAKHLRNHGVLSRARVLSAARRVTERKDSTDVQCVGRVQIEAPHGTINRSYEVRYDGLIPLGIYPCLVDTEGRYELQLRPIRKVPAAEIE